MDRVLALVLAGGKPAAMGPLTRSRCMAAVPFGGLYRIIDFCLTNLSESRIDHVGILSQYNSSSLMDHVGTGRPWEYSGQSRSLTFLPPYEGEDDMKWYGGTAGAVFKNLNFVRRYSPSDVLVLSGDHAYRMDYRPIVEQHRRTGADLTMALTPMHGDDLSMFGTAKLDRTGRVVEYREKSTSPCSNLVSMTVYVFRTDVLTAAVEANATDGRTYQIYDEVLPAMVSRGRVYGYVFRDVWEYLRPVGAWYDAHMKMLDPDGDPVPTAHVITNPDTQGLGDVPAASVTPTGNVTDSLIAPGCRIGGTVKRCVLSPRVVVEPGASVVDSVILDRCRIARGSKVLHAVLDKDCIVSRGCNVGDRAELVVLEKGTLVGNGHGLTGGTPVRAWVGSGVYTTSHLEEDPTGGSDMGWSG